MKRTIPYLIGVFCGIVFVVIKLAGKYDLLDLSASELTLVIGGGAALGAFVTYLFRLQSAVRKLK